MEALLSSLNNIGADGEDEEGLQEFLETMMSQLMSKEVLYEPLKEMHEKVRDFVFFRPPTNSENADSSLATSLRTRISCHRKIRNVTRTNNKQFLKSSQYSKQRSIQKKIIK